MLAEDLIKELERRPELARRLAEVLAPHIASYIAVPLNVATRDDVAKLEARLGGVERGVKGLGDEVQSLRSEVQGLEKEVQMLSRKLDALGARWGIFSEEAFRRGVGEFLKQAGYKVERWEHFDADGYVFGFPSAVDLDIIIKDGKVIVAEIKSSISRGDLASFIKKVELYEKVTGRKADGKYLLTYYIGERDLEKLKKVAENFGVVIIHPESLGEEP
ncbi:MAG: DUF3782 domain-containing protein [Thermoproteus sp.]